MKVLKAKYIFDNGVEKFDHYLYGIFDDYDLLTIVDERGKDPHLVYKFHDISGIWGAIDKLIHGQGEEISKNEYDKLVQKWIDEYNDWHPRYYDHITDSYFRIHDYITLREIGRADCNGVIYSYDGVQQPQYVRSLKEFNELYEKK
jgi:hypothetical protein